MIRSCLKCGLCLVVAASCTLLLISIYDTTTYQFLQDMFERFFLTAWAEQPENWQKCLDYTKDYAEKNLTWQPIPYPTGNIAAVNGCVVILVGSASRYQEDLARSLMNFDNQFNDMFHYPIFAFYTNLSDASKQSLKQVTRSKITFIKISKPNAEDPVSPLNPTLIREKNNQEYSFPLEYRFQTIFEHPAVKDYNYVLRIDNDIDLLTPINYDPFKFMEAYGMVFNYRHWSMDPNQICRGIYGPTLLYQVDMPTVVIKVIQRDMGRWVQNHDRPLPPQCYCGGGALFTAYAPFFRSPQFKAFLALIHLFIVKAYWNYIKCLGGVWTHRWAEQNLFPLSLALTADIPERRINFLSNFAVNHREYPLEPHYSWEIPPWPYHQYEGDKTIVANPPTVRGSGCIVYYTCKADIAHLRRSLCNLDYHFLSRFPYPVFVFHKDLTTDDEHLVTTALESKNVRILFSKVAVTKDVFFLHGMFEQKELADYGYFLRLDSRTNFVADVYWDLLKFMEDHQFILAYHRWHSPEVRLEPAENDALWDLSILNYPKGQGKLPPRNFSLSLEYFALGSFSFFRSRNYLDYIKIFADTAIPPLTSHIFPLAIAQFLDNPWKRVADVSSLMINWDTDSKDPFFYKGWWKWHLPTPTWGFQFHNRNPP